MLCTLGHVTRMVASDTKRCDIKAAYDLVGKKTTDTIHYDTAKRIARLADLSAISQPPTLSKIMRTVK